MRNSEHCPFVPGSDVVPEVWAGRTEHLSDWRDVIRPRRLVGRYERGRTILGEAGLGKSTLVKRIATKAEESGDWVTPQLRIAVGDDPLKTVAHAVLQLADKAGLSTGPNKRLGEILGRVQKVAAAGFSVAVHAPGDARPTRDDLTELIVEVCQAALDRGVMVLIHIDEVQNITDPAALSQLLTTLGDALAREVKDTAPGEVEVERTLPIAVYLTGLPEFADLAGARHGATFARRFKTEVLQPISEDDLETALQPFVTEGWELPSATHGQTHLITMEQSAQKAIAGLSCGEPFLFQLAGERAWYAGDTSVITLDDVNRGWQLVVTEAESHVQRILDRLPTREREFVEAMSALAPEDRTLTKIAAKAGFDKASSAGPTSQRLETVRRIISRRKPYRFSHRAVEAFLTTEWPYVGGPDED